MRTPSCKTCLACAMAALVAFAACTSESESHDVGSSVGGAAGSDASAGGQSGDAGVDGPSSIGGSGGQAGSGGAAGAAAATPLWPFDRPSLEQLAASPRKVIAHWHWFPTSFDNKSAAADYYATAFLNIHGEQDKHLAYGGYLRERPLGRLPRTEQDWKVRDMTRDAMLASEIGIDAFFLNLWTDSGDLFERGVDLLDGVEALHRHFKVAPNVDMTLVGGTTDEARQGLIVSMISKIQGHPALLWTDDHRLVLGAFRAETFPASFYQQLLARLKTDLQLEVALVPVFLGLGGTYPGQYAGVSDALAGWGTAIPETGSGPRETFVDTVHALGKIAAPPVLIQDFRPSSFAWWEASNSRTLRSQWEATIASQADWAHLVTWNDHAEHHALRPSTGKQWAPYDLSAYYITWFKTGTQPPIVRDALYYFHRIHSTSATPTEQAKTFELKAGTATDDVELVAFLTAPGTLRIELGGTVQSLDAPAGLTALRVPLVPGRPKFKLDRGSSTAVEFESAFDIRTTIAYQDLLYRSGGSLRASLHPVQDCKSFCEGNDQEGCLGCAAEPVWLVANPP